MTEFLAHTKSVIEHPKPLSHSLAEFTFQVSQAAGFSIIASLHRNPKTLAFAQREDIGDLFKQGLGTFNHLIR